MRFRFSLNAVLLLATLFAVTCGCLWSFWWVPGQQQRQAVEKISSQIDAGDGGSDCQYEPMDDFALWRKKLGHWLGKDSVARVTTVYSNGTSDISVWHGLRYVERVHLQGGLVDDLAVLKNFRNLKYFSVSGSGVPTSVGKCGLEVLAECHSLETVSLVEPKFTFNDQVFESICNAKNIRRFIFSSQSLTDLSPLERLVHLEELRITSYHKNNPPDLAPIGSLPNLKLLTLDLLTWMPDDFGFLANLTEIKYCLITGDLSTDVKAEIQSLLPSDCHVSFQR